jgi:8-oxo-dGTP diphosphatase
MTKFQKIVVTALITHKNKCLIIRRASHETFLPGYYELPSGKVDFGEDPQVALKREVSEETNLEIEVLQPYHYFSYLIDNKNRHNVEVFFLAQLNSDPSDIKLSPDHDDHQWITMDQLDDYQISEAIKTAILKGFEISYP